MIKTTKYGVVKKMNEFIIDFVHGSKNTPDTTITLEAKSKNAAIKKAKKKLKPDLLKTVLKIYVHEELDD